LEDGKALPAGTRLLVSRQNARDSQLLELDAHGGFIAEGLPTESYSLSVAVKGYRLSEANRSLDRMSGRSLVGLIDRNLDDIKILMVPGDPQRASPNNRPRITTRDLQKSLLQGLEE
jgi:hypothetical protein